MKHKLNNTVVLVFVLFEEEWRNAFIPRERMFQMIASRPAVQSDQCLMIIMPCYH